MRNEVQIQCDPNGNGVVLRHAGMSLRFETEAEALQYADSSLSNHDVIVYHWDGEVKERRKGRSAK